MKRLYAILVHDSEIPSVRDSGPFLNFTLPGDDEMVYSVPRWLAEACRFELDHEHDDEAVIAERCANLSGPADPPPRYFGGARVYA